MRPDVEAIFALGDDDFRDTVLSSAMALSGELADATEEQLSRVRNVVEEAWPADGVRVHVHREQNRVRFGDRGAYAWFTLASQLDLEPTAEQWVDIATSGAVWTDTADWLRRHYTGDVDELAAALDSNDAGVWGQLLGAIPPEAQLTDQIVDAAVACISEIGDSSEAGLWHIGERLGKAGRLDALQAISSRSEELEEGLREWRAQLGEVEAARTLVAQMIEGLKSQRNRDWDDPGWLEGVTDSELLPDLFDALLLDLEHERDDPFGPGRSLHRAILRIGGEEAVRRYDELIASSDEPRFKFLRLWRDEVVQSELRAVGQSRAGEVAAALSVPNLDS